MIVSDKNISTALEYLAIDPHPTALAKKAAVDAENKCKEEFARALLYRSGGATVDARKASVEIDPAFILAKENEAQAILNLECTKARSRAAEMLIEVWRTENANARAAERVR